VIDLPSLLFSPGAKGAPYLTFGLSNAGASWGAAACGLLLLGFSAHRPTRARLTALKPAPVLAVLSLLAAALSAVYVRHYLHGGPRIVDATSYFLEGRALSHGQVWFPVPEPRASFHGRFLLESERGLAVLFPPGYPLLLSLGFLVGAPMAIGPVLAALLVPATYGVARGFGAERVTAYVAAALGVVCAALRYHTADTMSHGLCALLVACAVALFLRPGRAAALGSGLALGLLLATRPVTGLFVTAAAAWASREPGSERLLRALGVLPGLGLLLWHQHTLTGDWLSSGQSAYYAVADGPPGCFRYGFGAGIGCWFEHGDFVRARLPHGYGAAAALGNTLRRLALHSADIANLAPLALLVPLGVWVGRSERGVRLGACAILGVIGGYAPFYFEGSYPGGGARFFADVLPLEHALIAIAAARLGWVAQLVPASLLGFTLHTSHQHELLASREGGRPMFEPGLLSERGLSKGLVFVNTDHGFSLAHDPGVTDPRTGIVVARERGDALDTLLWQRLGRPPAFRYQYDPLAGIARPTLAPYRPAALHRIEAESLYPPVALSGGWTHPESRGEPCVSGRKVLRLRPTSGRPLRFTLRLPSLSELTPRPSALAMGWVGSEPSGVLWRLGGSESSSAVAVPAGGPCWVIELPPPPPEQWAAPIELEVEAQGAGGLDYIDLTPERKSVDN
jgi:hypothetical protein